MLRWVHGLALAMVVLAATPAHAHKLKLFAATVGDRIDGRVYFVGGGGAAGASVRISAPDGEVIGALRTDNNGEFSFTATRRVDHLIIVDAGDGHSARLTVPARDLAPSLAAPADASGPANDVAGPAVATAPAATAPGGAPAALGRMVEDAVARQIVPVREQLNAYEDRLRLRDILGGIGYILGLAGLALWLKARPGTERRR